MIRSPGSVVSSGDDPSSPMWLKRTAAGVSRMGRPDLCRSVRLCPEKLVSGWLARNGFAPTAEPCAETVREAGCSSSSESVDEVARRAGRIGLVDREPSQALGDIGRSASKELT